MGDIQQDIIEKVNKDIGPGVATHVEDGSPSDVERFVSTGSTLLDYRIANQKGGGVPVGKITSISGLPGTGKTLFGMQICANAQKEGALIVYIDTERALNTDFAKRVGLDVSKNFIYMNPDSVEDAYQSMFRVFARLHESEKGNKNPTYPYVVIIWDSIAATPVKTDVTEENPDPGSNVGVKARIMSKMTSLLLKQVGRRRVAQIFLNQLRENIGSGPFAEKYVEPGGNAIPFHASARIRLTSIGKIKANDEIVGVKTRAEVKKTRFGPPFGKAEFNIYFTKGVDDRESIIDLLEKRKKIKSRNAGSKGKLYVLNDVELPKKELKKKLIQDKQLNKEVYKLLDDVMVRDLVDPDDHEEKVEKVE